MRSHRASGLRLIKAVAGAAGHCQDRVPTVNAKAPMRYEISARRLDATGSLATAHGAEVRLATGMQGRKDALTPVELPLSALAACMIKGTKRVTPKLNFQPDGRTVKLEADRQDSPERRQPRRRGRHPRVPVPHPPGDGVPGVAGTRPATPTGTPSRPRSTDTTRPSALTWLPSAISV